MVNEGMSWLRRGAIVVLLGGSTTAWGQDCAAPYGADPLLEDLGNVEQFLRNGDNAAANKVATEMATKLPCVNEQLPMLILGRAYRGIAGGLYGVPGTKARGEQWFKSAFSIDPTFSYGTEDLPAGHPIIGLYSDLSVSGVGSSTLLQGRLLVVGPKHWLDGRNLKSASAHPDMPHLYQQVAVDGKVQTFVIEGNAFPDAALQPLVAAVPEKGGKPPKAAKPPKGGEAVAAGGDKGDKGAKPPKGKKSGTPGITVTVNPAKFPAIIGGAVIAAGSGVTYFLATQERAKFDAAVNQEEMQKFRGSTNRYVVLSGALLVVGAGTLGVGLYLDADGSMLVGPSINVRW